MRPVFLKRRDGSIALQPRSLLGMPSKASAEDHRALRSLACSRWCEVPCPVHDDTDPFHITGDVAPVARTGAHKLQLAVLEDAARIIARGVETAAMQCDFTRAVWWVEARCSSHPNFSLRDICDSLDLDYQMIRRELTAMARKAQKVPEARRSIQTVTKPRARRLSAA